MRLENSIVIVKSREFKAQGIDLVLLVKHPQGIDPVERIHLAIHGFLSSEAGQQILEVQPEFSWNDLLGWMNTWDWSAQQLYIEDVLSWAVIEPEESMFPKE